MLRKGWIRLALLLALGLISIAVVLVVSGAPITVRLILEVVGIVVGGVVVGMPLARVAAILMAKATPEWGPRRDLIWEALGSLLFGVGLFSPPLIGFPTLIGFPISLLGLSIMVGTFNLSQVRKAKEVQSERT